jgi:lipopolysaccharide transport system ATP-binding protein
MSAIVAKGLGKQYRLGSAPGAAGRFRYRTLRESLAGLFRRSGGTQAGTFWALQDLDFRIEPGEAVAVTGRNGSGKSTLLKLLSRVTGPTAGRIELRGRVGSLLEVGTGFHPELTGRENIYLNAAILGMSRAEVKRQFDAIVSFAEVERFLDTPVKRYSSGMYVRLAFAVAAHLEPEILVVDEVLAVGDAEFQRKCLGKMNEVAHGHGRTVLFVSHNMSSVAALCRRGILLERGRLVADGPVHDVIAKYLARLDQHQFAAEAGGDRAAILSARLDPQALARGMMRLHVEWRSPQPVRANIGVVVSSAMGTPLFGTNAETHPPAEPIVPATHGTATLEIPDLPLHSGLYKASLWLTALGQPGVLDQRPDAVAFEYVSPHFVASLPPTEVIGHLRVEGAWTMRAEAPQ